jgi:nucleoside triphosphate diphosphatase
MKAKTRESLVDGLPADLPSLHRAFRLQDRAAGVGFDWPDAAGPAEKVEEELAEVRAEIANGAQPSGYGVPDPRLEEELGDLLFSVVNLCRKLGVHPALALDKANGKFSGRFQAVEALAKRRGLDVRTAGLDALDALWNEVKTG